MTDQLSPKEIALKTLDCGGHTCNNFKVVDNAIDIAIKKTKEQLRDWLKEEIKRAGSPLQMLEEFDKRWVK